MASRGNRHCANCIGALSFPVTTTTSLGWFPASSVRRLSTVTLFAFAAERRAVAPLLPSAGVCCTAPAAVDRYLLPTWRSAANPPHAAVLSIDGTDGRTERRTDRQTPDRYIDPAAHTVRQRQLCCQETFATNNENLITTERPGPDDFLLMLNFDWASAFERQFLDNFGL